MNLSLAPFNDDPPAPPSEPVVVAPKPQAVVVKQGPSPTTFTECNYILIMFIVTMLLFTQI